MSNVLFQTIDQISREKGIDPQIVIHAIEESNRRIVSSKGNRRDGK